MSSDVPVRCTCENEEVLGLMVFAAWHWTGEARMGYRLSCVQSSCVCGGCAAAASGWAVSLTRLAIMFIWTFSSVNATLLKTACDAGWLVRRWWVSCCELASLSMKSRPASSKRPPVSMMTGMTLPLYFRCLMLW